jgi:WD40 repeat protein
LRRWRRVAISPDGACLAVAGSHAIDLWDLDTCARITRLVVESDNVHGIFAVYFRSNNVLTCISRESPAAVVTWALDSGQIIDRAELPLPQGAWQRALMTPNQEYFVAASGNDTTVWRLDTRGCVAAVAHGIAGQGIAVSSDGELAATAGHDVRNSADSVDDRVVRLWSLPDLREICRWNLLDLGCRDIVCALAFSPDGRHLVLAGWEGVLRRLILPKLARHNQ